MTAPLRYDSRVLRATTADRELSSAGFTVVPLPEVEPLAGALHAAYGRLHGWHGQGFEPDLVNPDTGYRRQVHQVISEALDDLVTDLFDGYTPFLRNFLCKWPGEGSDLYLHRDWMYVDERAGARTFVVWIPLVDVTEENGPLQVLRASHRLERRPRGTHLNAPWINHGEVIRPRMETVTARLGEAVLMDNALVHSSLPNRSGEPRLVAAVGCRPTDSPLVHFLSTGAGPAVRYDTDDDFFLTLTPQGLMAAPPTLEVVEELDPHQWELEAADLADRLDDLARQSHAELATDRSPGP